MKEKQEIKITDKINQKYLNNPHLCPFCDSDHFIQSIDSYFSGNVYCDTVRCKDCKTIWTELYILSEISYAYKDE